LGENREIDIHPIVVDVVALIAWRYHIAFQTGLNSDEILIPCGRDHCFTLVLPTRFHEEPEIKTPGAELLLLFLAMEKEMYR
jgi:hypothetical protein